MKGGFIIPKERHEYIKSIIQDALWKTYKQTDEAIYYEVYREWFNKFESIDITNLE